MKKFIIVPLFFFAQLYLNAQTLDLIVKTDGDSIICLIDNISRNRIYFEFPAGNRWSPAFLNTKYVKKIERNGIKWDDGVKKRVKIKNHITWITLYSEPFRVKGILYKLNDSSVVITNYPDKAGRPPAELFTIHYKIQDIKKISFRRKNKIARGVAFGAIPGLILSIAAYASGDDPPGTFGFTAEEKFYMTLPLVGFGAGLGALFGSIRTIFHITGKMEKYEKYKHRLLKYSIVYQLKHGKPVDRQNRNGGH